MAVRLPGKRRDARVEQILSNPKSYFAKARASAREAVQAERAAQQQPRVRRRPA